MSRDINFLLNQYNSRIPSEKWSKESNTEYQREYRTKQKIFIFDQLNKDYNLQGSRKTRAKYIITRLDFNKVNPRLSLEEIITMIALYVRTEYSPKTYYRYKYMLENKGITEATYITFLTGLNKNISSSN